MDSLIPLDNAPRALDAGGKGRGLRWLLERGASTPRTWIVLASRDHGVDLSALELEASYAIRSSANVEDGDEASFAGQFATVLDVSGEAALRDAIRVVRDSVRSEAVAGYAARMGVDRLPEMHVLVQLMVAPVASGVVFTRNPITGLSENVLEAVAGRGDQLVQDGITPQRWVRRWGAWTAAPEDPVLPDDVATRIIDDAQRLASDYGRAVDLEWVWDGETIWWLQVRPITAVGDVGIYSNRISKEVMPGLIKPLVWSVNVPVVNRAWIRLLSEAAGDLQLEPDDLARQFAYRSYFNMGAIGDVFEALGMPRDSLELLLGLPEGPEKPRFKPTVATMRKLPRLAAFAMRRVSFGRRLDDVILPLRTSYEPFDGDPTELPDDAIFQAVEQLMELGTDAAYANIVIPLLANGYTSLLRSRLEKRGLDLAEIDLGVDVSEVDPNHHLAALGGVIEEAGPDSDRSEEALAAFLDRFGHLSDSGTDFSVAPWAERPELVRTMAVGHRRSESGSRRIPWSEVEDSVGFMARPLFGVLKRRAAHYQEGRERISFLYTWGYGLFRPLFLEVGRRLVDRGTLQAADDVMYLSLGELQQVVAGDVEPQVAMDIVTRHRTEMDRVANAQMPEVVYGEDFVPASPAEDRSVLRGVGTSRGHYRGRLRIVRGLDDFDSVEPGEVLAIPYSDVGWTPLFAKAGAVLAESGGMLSHSSIVAREYGIPCVVSVPGVMSLTNGTVVTVDGYVGEVTIG